MHKELAEMYENGENTEEIQKQASAELAEKLAEEGAMDLSDLSIEDIEGIARDLIADTTETQSDETATEGEGEPEKTASETEPELDEGQQKFAEADFLGRVMAHSFTQERREIEKQAGAKATKAGMLARHYAGKVADHVKKHGKKYSAGAGGAGGVVAGRMSKKSSATPALDTLVEARVQEILAANNIKPEQEKTSAADEEKANLVAQTVEAKAVERLKEMGYEFEEPKAE
jgi:hypothetical protein